MSDGVPRYSTVAGRALLLGSIGAVANFLLPHYPIALTVNVFCLWHMFDRARAYAANGEAGFDSIIAAEAMVGFGIFSLVLGLASIILRVMLGQVDVVALQSGNSTALLDFIPFVEGLVTAGFAPFFAILLRLTVFEMPAAAEAVDDMDALTRATAALTRSMKDAVSAIDRLKSGAAAAGTTTAGLATTMKVEADRWALALQEGEAGVKMLGESSRNGSAHVGGLADETHRLKVAAGDSATLLGELSRLIEAVERFVAPGAARS